MVRCRPRVYYQELFLSSSDLIKAKQFNSVLQAQTRLVSKDSDLINSSEDIEHWNTQFQLNAEEFPNILQQLKLWSDAYCFVPSISSKKNNTQARTAAYAEVCGPKWTSFLCWANRGSLQSHMGSWAKQTHLRLIQAEPAMWAIEGHSGPAERPIVWERHMEPARPHQEHS